MLYYYGSSIRTSLIFNYLLNNQLSHAMFLLKKTLALLINMEI